METESKRCIATRRDGCPCQATAVGPGGYCFTHDPEQVAKRDAARQRGGKNSAKIVRLRALVPPRLVPIYDRLEQAMEEVHAGQLRPAVAGAMAALARAMVSVLTAGEMESRVRNLEDRLDRTMAGRLSNGQNENREA